MFTIPVFSVSCVTKHSFFFSQHVALKKTHKKHKIDASETLKSASEHFVTPDLQVLITLFQKT